MLNFPQTTEFNKRIPKQKFYENLSVTPTLKRAFVEQIKSVVWANKIAPSTISVAEGRKVTEIEVFQITLNSDSLDELVLKQIDKQIPYHILFVLCFEDRVQVWTGYKEASESGNTPFKLNKYYHTDWLPQDELNLKIEGLNMDTVWENFIVQVGGVEVEQGKSLDEQIQFDEQKAKLQKEIEKLEKRARNEKQPNKKFQLVQQAKELKKQLALIHNS